MASVSWTQTTGGSWFTPGAWSTGADPLRGDDVTINTPTASITVTYSTGSLALDSLTTGATDTLSVTGGTLSMANGYNIQGALLLSAGLLRLTGGSYGTALQNNVTISGGALFFANSATALSGTFTETAGTITIAHGVFNDTDSGAIGGTITGAGELLLSTGGTTTLKSGAALSTGAVDITNGTVLLQEKLGYAGDFSLTGTLDLNGNSGTLTGFVGLDGDINGGSLILSGSGHLNAAILDNGAELTIQSSINETGNVQLGGGSGTGTLNVTSAGTLRIAGNDGLTQGQNAGMVINAGLIEKVAGNSIVGTSYVFDAVNNTGIIDAAVGTIDFRGPGGGAESTINGTLMGAGTIAFDNGDYILGSHAGLALDSTRLVFSGSTSVTLASALSYGGNWVQNGGLLLFENALTLSGTTDFDGGELKGTATITDSGPLTLGTGMDLEGNLSFAFDGNVDQTGAINLGRRALGAGRRLLHLRRLWHDHQ
jgi:hypothetical protein